MKKILHVVGARPNFMKLAPVYEGLAAYSQDIKQVIVHTGQHFDYNMSDVFFEQLGIPEPDINLEISGGSVISQIGNGLLKIEQVLLSEKPDIICLYGDVNATAFSSIAASKLGVKIAHVEAGLRSYDRDMPEETNRMITDCLTDYYFTPSVDADENLVREGILPEKIFFVGNVMIDTLKKFLPYARQVKFPFEVPANFALVTLHRPSNVDSKDLEHTLSKINEIGEATPVIFPMHPRTRSKLAFDYVNTYTNILFTDPLSYFEFVALEEKAAFIITDSGGVQEESTYLKTPCFTLRDNTERPVTITEGSNTLVGSDIDVLKPHIDKLRNDGAKAAKIPELWDGEAGKRIGKKLHELLYGAKQ